jgi:hypothetical protein
VTNECRKHILYEDMMVLGLHSSQLQGSNVSLQVAAVSKRGLSLENKQHEGSLLAITKDIRCSGLKKMSRASRQL